MLSSDELLQELVRQNANAPETIKIDVCKLRLNHSAINRRRRNYKNMSAERIIKVDTRSLSKIELIAIISRAVEISTGYYPRDAQILALLLSLKPQTNAGRFLEVGTGEGKSLIVAMLAAYKALHDGLKVDIITSSSVLAKRDAENPARIKLFKMLGLRVAHNTCNAPRNCYGANILYGDMDSFQGDLLADEFKGEKIRANRPFQCVILDEVDSMLNDDIIQGRILKLSFKVSGMEYLNGPFIVLHAYFSSQMVQFEEEQAKKNENTLEKAEKEKKKFIEHLKKDCTGILRSLIREEPHQLLNKLYSNENVKLAIPSHLKEHALEQVPKWVDSLVASRDYSENRDYVIGHDGEGSKKVMPVDYANTGVTQTNLHWGDGLHQFLQLKHKLPLTAETMTTSFISNHGFVMRYSKNRFGLSGTLGTADTHAFLKRNFDVDIAIVPRYKVQIARHVKNLLLPCFWCYTICEIVYNMVRQGRAVLVIFQTIDELNETHGKLKEMGEQEDAHRPIAKFHLYCDSTQELEEIVVQMGDVILATNLAGRGADFSTSPEVEENGGLHVIVAYFPANKRVECQAFGRTGRQGKKGTYQLVIHNYQLPDYLKNEEINKNSIDINNNHSTDTASADAANDDGIDANSILNGLNQLIDEWRRRRDENEAEFVKNCEQGEMAENMKREGAFQKFVTFFTGELRPRVRRKLNESTAELTLRQVEEHWGFFFKRNLVGNNDKNAWERKFSTFLREERSKLDNYLDHGDLSFFTNICYLVLIGNELFENNLNRAANCFHRAYNLEKSAFDAVPNYYLALAEFRQNTSDEEKARNEICERLNKTMEGIAMIMNSLQLQLCTFAENEENPARRKIQQLSEFYNHFFENCKGNLEISAKCPSNKIVVLERWLKSQECYPTVAPKELIKEMANFGLERFYKLGYKERKRNWWSILGMALLCVIQFVGGLYLLTTGTLALGKTLMEQAIRCGGLAFRSAVFNEVIRWGKWLIDTLISYAGAAFSWTSNRLLGPRLAKFPWLKRITDILGLTSSSAATGTASQIVRSALRSEVKNVIIEKTAPLIAKTAGFSETDSALALRLFDGLILNGSLTGSSTDGCIQNMIKNGSEIPIQIVADQVGQKVGEMMDKQFGKDTFMANLAKEASVRYVKGVINRGGKEFTNELIDQCIRPRPILLLPDASKKLIYSLDLEKKQSNKIDFDNNKQAFPYRVVLVERNGKVVYEAYILPDSTIDVDVPVRDELISNNARPLAEVREELGKILDNNILVGHGLKNDLKDLGIEHAPDLQRDTAEWKRLRKGMPCYDGESKAMIKRQRPSLAALAHHHLHIKIVAMDTSKAEMDELSKQHPDFKILRKDTVLDAQIPMKIYNKYEREWEEDRLMGNEKESGRDRHR